MFSFSQANKMAAGSGYTSILPQSFLPRAHSNGAEGWSWIGGGSYASTSSPDPWRGAASVAVAPTMPPPFTSFNKLVFLLFDLSIWDWKTFMEVQQMGPWLRDVILHVMEQQLAGQGELLDPPCASLTFFLIKLSMPQVRVPSANLLAGKHWTPDCVLKQLEIRPRSGLSCAPCCLSWKLLLGSAILHHPRHFEESLLVDGRPKYKRLEESMALQDGNLYMRIWGTFPNPCFSAQFYADVCHCEDDDYAQDIVLWSEALMWCNDYCEILLDLPCEVATSLLLISNFWYHKFSLYQVLPLEILGSCFWPMIFAAHGLECWHWNNILSVSLWSQANTIAANLNHHLCSHTTVVIFGQQRFWSCHYAYKTINGGNANVVLDSFLFSFQGTMLYLPDDHLVEDAVLSPFGLCHQRCTTTSLLLIPRFNGGDPLRLSSVMVQQNLQLNLSQPRVHTPSGEPPAGHQLVWSTLEALQDCRCSNIESGLSTDERSLFGFIGNLGYHLQVFRSSLFYSVHLGTFHPRSTCCRRDMLYSEL